MLVSLSAIVEPSRAPYWGRFALQGGVGRGGEFKVKECLNWLSSHHYQSVTSSLVPLTFFFSLHRARRSVFDRQDFSVA